MEEEFFAIQEQVVISASKKAQKISEAPAAITVITGEEIRKYGFKTIGEVLDIVPGVYNSSDRNNEYGIIRGLHISGDNNKRILVLLNGHTLNNGVTMETSLGYELGIPMNAIERIEVLRGAGSVMYGANAFFGVINIILKDSKESDEKGKTLVDVNIGQYNLKENSIIYHSPKNKVFVAAQIRENKGAPFSTDYNYKWLDLLATMEDPLYSASNNTFFKGTEVRDVDFDKVYSLISSFQISKIKFLTKLTNVKEGMPLGDWKQALDQKDKYEKMDNLFLEANYSTTINEKYPLSFRLYTKYYNWSDKLYYHELDADSGGNTYIPNFREIGIPNGSYWIDRLKGTWNGAEVKVEGSFLEGKLNSISGIEYINKFNKSDYHAYNFNWEPDPNPAYHSNWISKKINGIAIYNEISYSISEKLKSLFGARFDKITDFSGEISPRIAFIYSPTEQSNYKFIIGKAFRTPGYKEYAYDDGDLLPNPDLKPEIIYSGDLISTFSFKNLTLSIDLFYSSFDNLIVKNSAAIYDVMFLPSFYPRSMYQNPYKIKNYGIETSLKGKLNKLNYFLNFLIIDNNQSGKLEEWEDTISIKVTEKDEGVKNSIRYCITAGGNIEYKLFNYALILKYISKRDIELLQPIELYGIDGSAPTIVNENYPTKTKKSLLVDVNINTIKRYKGFSFGIAIKDLFDSKREEPARSTSCINMVKTEGRKIIGNINYEF